MIDPTCTFSSPYFFTPRYCGLESRPFFVDPVPFLCAHSMTARRGARSSTRAGAMRRATVESLDDNAACMVTMTVDAGVGVCGAMQSWGRSFCLWLIPCPRACVGVSFGHYVDYLFQMNT